MNKQEVKKLEDLLWSERAGINLLDRQIAQLLIKRMEHAVQCKNIKNQLGRATLAEQRENLVEGKYVEYLTDAVFDMGIPQEKKGEAQQMTTFVGKVIAKGIMSGSRRWQEFVDLLRTESSD